MRRDLACRRLLPGSTEPPGLKALTMRPSRRANSALRTASTTTSGAAPAATEIAKSVIPSGGPTVDIDGHQLLLVRREADRVRRPVGGSRPVPLTVIVLTLVSMTSRSGGSATRSACAHPRRGTPRCRASPGPPQIRERPGQFHAGAAQGAGGRDAGETAVSPSLGLDVFGAGDQLGGERDDARGSFRGSMGELVADGQSA